MKTLTFTEKGDKWVAEYTGSDGSGALQLEFDKIAEVTVHGSANGVNYCLLDGGQLKGSTVLRYLNMAGLQKVKVVCSAEPISGVVNQ